MSIESVMSSNHLILCCPLFLLPSIFPSIRVFSNKSVLHIRGPKDWSFSFSISPSNEYTGLISFRIDWFDSLAVQGTLKTAWVQILPLPNYQKHFPRQAMSPHRPQLSHLQNGHLQRLCLRRLLHRLEAQVHGYLYCSSCHVIWSFWTFISSFTTRG